MKLEIFPYKGVGMIKLGMSQADVRQAVGSEFETFMKSNTSEMPTDYFVGKGIFAYYKLPGLCEAVEMASPADPIFAGARLIGSRFSEIMPIIVRVDPTASIHSMG